MFCKALPEDSGSIARIIACAYADDFRPLTKDTGKVSAVFENALNTDMFYIVKSAGVISGVAAVSGKNSRAVRLDRKLLRKTFGPVRGIIFGVIAKKEIERVRTVDGKTGYVEFVAVAESARGNGLSGKLMRYIIDERKPFEKYILDVKDTNAPAVKTYERLGFKKYKREKVNKRCGFNYKIYMSYSKEG